MDSALRIAVLAAAALAIVAAVAAIPRPGRATGVGAGDDAPPEGTQRRRARLDRVWALVPVAFLALLLALSAAR